MSDVGGSGQAWHRLKSDKKAMVSMAVLVVLALVAALGPFVVPHDPTAQAFDILQSPSLQHPMGTDSLGRDVLSRVIAGARVSAMVGLGVAFIGMLIGVTLGLLAGFFGGRVDDLISRYVDLQWAFPELILAIALISIFGAGVDKVIIAIAFAYVDDFARLARAEALRLKQEEFVLAARVTGISSRGIITGEILPNAIGPLVVQATIAVGLGILGEATLTFLGLGVEPSTPTWGLILEESRDFFQQAWWLGIFPGLAIVVTVLSLNLLGDSLRDALDVRGPETV
ncbi:MAG: ABC transporter permease [Carbonactinosporaceae bacterium]